VAETYTADFTNMPDCYVLMVAIYILRSATQLIKPPVLCSAGMGTNTKLAVFCSVGMSTNMKLAVFCSVGMGTNMNYRYSETALWAIK
jgi:hypothetical protein